MTRRERRTVVSGVYGTRFVSVFVMSCCRLLPGRLVRSCWIYAVCQMRRLLTYWVVVEEGGNRRALLVRFVPV